MVTAVAGVAAVLSSWWRRQKKRRPAWVLPCYLDLCISTQQEFGGVVDHLDNCARVWRGVKGEDKHPVGCGDRVRCPLCADYYHSTLAREGIAIVEALLAAAEAKGYERDTWGEHIELTLPKAISEALDTMLDTDPDNARDKVNKLRQAAWRVVKKAVKGACHQAGMPDPGELAAVMVVHHWGSSIPWLPHWHIHIYLLPYTCDYPVYVDRFRWKGTSPDQWRSLPRWWETEALEELRTSWKKAAERILGIKYPGDWDIKRGYLGKERQMLHTLAYQMRAPLRDIWKGVRGDHSQGFGYRAKGKPGQPSNLIPVSVADFEAAYERAEAVRLWLTRITWYGYLSNTKQAATMKSLDLEVEEDPAAQESKDKGKYWRPVDETSLGVLFQATDDSGETDFVEWSQLCPEPVSMPCEKPIGATRRRRWIARSPPVGT